MVKIGFTTLPSFSHAQSLLCLALALRDRGHQIVFIGLPDLRKRLSKYPDIAFVSYGDDFSDPNHRARMERLISRHHGFLGRLDEVRMQRRETEIGLRCAPSAIRDAQIDLLITDQVSYFWPAIAEHLRIPYITFCSALIFLSDPHIPSMFTSRPVSTSFLGILRNRVEHFVWHITMRRVWNLICAQRQEWGLRVPRGQRELELSTLSPLAVLGQCCDSLEFPRKHPLPQAHLIGRWCMPDRSDPLVRDLPFPYDKLQSGRKIVYASLGTVQSRNIELLHMIADSMAKLDAQLILSLGTVSQDQGNSLEEQFAGSDTIIVPFAPQATLIPKVDVVVTHAGLNTVLMALEHGKPVVTIPFARDQPGVASRAAFAGAAVVVPAQRANTLSLRRAIQAVLENNKYRDAAQQVAADIRASGGVERAVNIVEEVIRTGKPVYNNRSIPSFFG